MALISILISLFLDRYLESYKHLRALKNYRKLLEKLFGKIQLNGEIAVLIAVAIPLVLIGVLQVLIGHTLFGLGFLLLSIVTLFFCLGPKDLEKEVERYLQALESGDEHDIEESTKKILGEVSLPESAQGSTVVVEAILVNANIHIAAVIFWFVWLGPFGAVLYRASLFLVETPPEGLLKHSKTQKAAENLLGILTWIPTRLLGFAYALTGCFKESIEILFQKRDQQNIYAENNALLAEVGLAALCQDPGFTEGSQEEDAEDNHATQVRSAKALAFRGLILWLGMIALMTLAGWFT